MIIKTSENDGMNDSGSRISYGDDKAIREPTVGKGRFDLISPFAMERLAKWTELGSLKYAVRNWEKGMPYSRYLDSANRHLNNFLKGMEDEDHLAAAAWNIFAIMHHQSLGQDELDDLPHYLRETSNNSLEFETADYDVRKRGENEED